MSELAISTYKHTTRLRSARLVGLDLGNFYCSLNEPHKAVVFFIDLLREFKTENWNCLVSQTLLELANCYRKMDDRLRYAFVFSLIKNGLLNEHVTNLILAIQKLVRQLHVVLI